jgi:hypothetical protein
MHTHIHTHTQRQAHTCTQTDRHTGSYLLQVGVVCCDGPEASELGLPVVSLEAIEEKHAKGHLALLTRKRPGDGHHTVSPTARHTHTHTHTHRYIV